jgi:DNA-binding transcriptional ArsR family regulator
MDSDDDQTNATARVHRVLASTVRAGMLRLVAEQPQSVTDVARVSRISVSMASRHLAMLAAAGLIVRERNGSWVVHRLTPAGSAALQTSPGNAGRPTSLSSVDAQVHDASDLTDLAEDDVEFVLIHGLAAFAVGMCDRHGWLERLTWDLGPEWGPRLPTVWEAAMRLFRGESLQGLPLPPGLVADPPVPPTLRPAELGHVPQQEDR